MSYSFRVTADTKDALKTKISAEFEKVVAGQPAHELDVDAANAAASAFLDMVGELGANQEYCAYISGSLGWRMLGDERIFTSANLTVNAGTATKTTAV